MTINHSKMDATATLVMHEAVGIFDNEVSMQAAIDDLLTAGFGRCELSFAGKQDGTQADETAVVLDDDPRTARTNQFSPEVLGDAEGSLTGGFALIPVLGASWPPPPPGAGSRRRPGLPLRPVA